MTFTSWLHVQKVCRNSHTHFHSLFHYYFLWGVSRIWTFFFVHLYLSNKGMKYLRYIMWRRWYFSFSSDLVFKKESSTNYFEYFQCKKNKRVFFSPDSETFLNTAHRSKKRFAIVYCCVAAWIHLEVYFLHFPPPEERFCQGRPGGRKKNLSWQHQGSLMFGFSFWVKGCKCTCIDYMIFGQALRLTCDTAQCQVSPSYWCKILASSNLFLHFSAFIHALCVWLNLLPATKKQK